MARPIAREAAHAAGFEQLFGGDATAQTLVDLIDYNPNEKDSTYIDTVVGGVKEHADELDSEISACLRGWTLARLSRVDLAIMRLAVYEAQYTGLPAAVAINEAVELTRSIPARNPARLSTACWAASAESWRHRHESCSGHRYKLLHHILRVGHAGEGYFVLPGGC
ncbi:MAG: transcription antitermination factor NusB [Christensenellales bacterium]